MDAGAGVAEAQRTMAEGGWPLLEAGIAEGLGASGVIIAPHRETR